MPLEEIQLLRFQYESTHTYGRLILSDDLSLWTIENPWICNAPNISCIPCGIYQVSQTQYYRGKPEPYPTLQINGVPGRTKIKIHRGNTTKDTRGCPLIGTELGALFDKPAVLHSRKAYAVYWEALKDAVPKRILVANALHGCGPW